MTIATLHTPYPLKKITTMKTTVTSNLYSLGKSDFLKGLIMFVGTPTCYAIQELIPSWPLNPIEKAALSATITYLLKNLFDKPKIVISDGADLGDKFRSGAIKVQTIETK